MARVLRLRAHRRIFCCQYLLLKPTPLFTFLSTFMFVQEPFYSYDLKNKYEYKEEKAEGALDANVGYFEVTMT